MWLFVGELQREAEGRVRTVDEVAEAEEEESHVGGVVVVVVMFRK